MFNLHEAREELNILELQKVNPTNRTGNDIKLVYPVEVRGFVVDDPCNGRAENLSNFPNSSYKKTHDYTSYRHSIINVKSNVGPRGWTIDLDDHRDSRRIPLGKDNHPEKDTHSPNTMLSRNRQRNRVKSAAVIL